MKEHDEEREETIMAKGKKTGGRSFPRGNPGRPKGSKNKIPGSFKASVKAIFEELALEERANWKGVIRKIMRRPVFAAFPWYQLALHVLDGKPAEHIKMEEPQQIVIVMGEDPDTTASSNGASARERNTRRAGRT